MISISTAAGSVGRAVAYRHRSFRDHGPPRGGCPEKSQADCSSSWGSRNDPVSIDGSTGYMGAGERRPSLSLSFVGTYPSDTDVVPRSSGPQPRSTIRVAFLEGHCLKVSELWASTHNGNIPMSLLRESAAESYDAIVIGSGIGGLTTAALLAKAGRRVLVTERHDRPGGYAHSFQRGRYHFDAAVHQIGGCQPTDERETGLIDMLLRRLDVRNRCEFLRVNPFYAGLFPGFRIDASTGLEEFAESYGRIFPAEAQTIRETVDLSARIAREVRRLPAQLTGWDLLSFPRKFPTLFRYRNATLGQVLDARFRDPRLKASYATLWPYLGLPPSRLSFVYWSLMLMSYVREGAYYCRGTFQNLANALVEAVRRNHGELLLLTRVRRIRVRAGRAEGVVLENGQRIDAPVVVSNADVRETFEELVGLEHVPRSYASRLRSMRPSLSAFVTFLATSLDLRKLGAAHEMFLFRSWDHEGEYRSVLEGRPAATVVAVPSLTDSSLAPKGEHVVSLTTLVPYDVGTSWRTEKKRFGEELLRTAESAFPGLTESAKNIEEASPRTMERYTLNFTGSIYGWEVAPDQVGPKRLDHRTPILGLLLSGHWTQPGGGIYAVAASGLQTAQAILGEAELNRILAPS